jgi:beta-lactamase class A
VIRWRFVLAALTLAATAGIVTGFVVEPGSAPVAVPGIATRYAVMPAPLTTADPPPARPASEGDVAAQRRQQNEAGLVGVLQRYDNSRYVDVALTVVDRRTGRVFSYNGQRPFQTASIVKVDLLASLLLQAQRNRRSLTASEKTLATAMIEYSDNAAATDLWTRTGGISRSTGVFGLTATRSGTDGRWGSTMTTTEDQARLITSLAGPDSPVEDADYLFDLMKNVDDSQSWGISAAARPGETVALKNGWMPRANQDDRWTVNSIGRITDGDTDVVVAVLSRGHASLQAGVGVVETVARTAREYLGW